MWVQPHVMSDTPNAGVVIGTLNTSVSFTSCLVVHTCLSVVVLIIKVLTLVILDCPLSIPDTNLKSYKLLYYNCVYTLFYNQ